MSEAWTFPFLYFHDSRCCTLFWFCRDCVVANLSAGKFYEFPLSPGLGSNFASGLCLLCPPSPHLCAANRALCRHEGNLILICNSPAHMRMIRTKRVALTNNDDDNFEHHGGRAVMITLTTPTRITIRREGECTTAYGDVLDAEIQMCTTVTGKNMQNFGLRHLHSPHPLESYFSKYCKTILPLTLLFWRQMKIGW